VTGLDVGPDVRAYHLHVGFEFRHSGFEDGFRQQVGPLLRDVNRIRDFFSGGVGALTRGLERFQELPRIDG
jgi:hypothetical protein